MRVFAHLQLSLVPASWAAATCSTSRCPLACPSLCWSTQQQASQVRRRIRTDRAQLAGQGCVHQRGRRRHHSNCCACVLASCSGGQTCEVHCIHGACSDKHLGRKGACTFPSNAVLVCGRVLWDAVKGEACVVLAAKRPAACNLQRNSRRQSSCLQYCKHCGALQALRSVLACCEQLHGACCRLLCKVLHSAGCIALTVSQSPGMSLCHPM